MIAWQTRTICQYVAATVPMEEGQQNPLIESASKISLGDLPVEEAKLTPAEPPSGSYERFLAAFGGGGGR